MRKKHFGVILLILLIYVLHSNKSSGQELNFEHYNINDGLSASVVNCIYQDSFGYMWFGTQDGLNLFDGYSFEKFINNPLDSFSISDNWIYGITEDVENNLWIASRGGVHKFNRKENRFYNLLEMQNKIAYGISIDSDGDIIVNAFPQLIKINPKTMSLKSFDTGLEPNSGVEDQTQPIMQDSEGFIWIASTKGLIRFDLRSERFEYFRQENVANNIIYNNITALFEDTKGNIWIGTNNGVSIYSYKTQSFHTPFSSNTNYELSSNFIRSIFQVQDNICWIGTEGGGLNKIIYNPSTLEIEYIEHSKLNQNNPNSISHDIVHAILQDRTGVLWLGTLAGIDKTDLKKKKFNLYRKSTSLNSVNLLDNVISSIYKDDNNNIWVGNWGRGLNIYNRNTGHVEHYSSTSLSSNRISNDFVHVIFEDSKNNVWIGTRNGIDVYHKDKKQFLPLQSYFNNMNIPSFKQNRIYCIIEDRANNVWIGTRNGLYVLNIDNFSYKYYSTDIFDGKYISDNLVYDLLEDSEGYIWIGTHNGLDRYNPTTNTMTHILRDKNEKNTLCDNFIVSLCEDSENNIWIGTKSGANKFNKKDSTFLYYSEKDGLPGNVIYEILKDNNNNLWFGTGKGLTVYYPGKDAFKTFDVEDGLQSMEFNLNARFKSGDGEVFFGGMNGFNSFYPDSMNNNSHIPPIVITSFEKENKEGKDRFNMFGKNKIDLKYNDYAFNIEFTALDYTNPQKNQYKYKIDELMDNWAELGNRRFVPFSNINPGKYTFRVKGTNNDGLWNEEGTVLNIIIHPPWWKSQVAYISYVLLIVVSVILFIRIRERKLKKEKQVLENKVQERTVEINKQKEKIEESYNNVRQLSDIGKKITSLLSVESIVNTVYDNVNTLMDAALFTIGFYSKSNKTLEFPIIKEMGENIPYISFSTDETDYPAIHCLLNQQEIIINSDEDYLKFTEKPPQIGEKAKSAIYIPLLQNNQTIGVITVQSLKEDAYSEYHINILRNIAIYTSIALENADAIKEIENQKEEIEAQRDEIQAQRDLATNQRDHIAKQNKDITNSIQYAKRIQSALLPSYDTLMNIFPEHFVYYVPRDIVSGDFYWVREKQDNIYIAAADCTGHGVPGAFVSLLGISYLNEIIQKQPDANAANILHELRHRIKSSLHHSGKANEPKDGMDIALTIFEKDKKKVQFAGAYNPLYIIRDSELLKFNGDKMPIGVHRKEKDFSNHTIDIEQNDQLYMFSDGYIDQFGGNRGKKFLKSNFENLLMDIKHETMDDQKIIIHDTFTNWKGDNRQIDDILVMGLKV